MVPSACFTMDFFTRELDLCGNTEGQHMLRELWQSPGPLPLCKASAQHGHTTCLKQAGLSRQDRVQKIKPVKVLTWLMFKASKPRTRKKMQLQGGRAEKGAQTAAHSNTLWGHTEACTMTACTWSRLTQPNISSQQKCLWIIPGSPLWQPSSRKPLICY